MAVLASFGKFWQVLTDAAKMQTGVIDGKVYEFKIAVDENEASTPENNPTGKALQQKRRSEHAERP